MIKPVFTASGQKLKVRMVCYGVLLVSLVLIWASTLIMDPANYNEREDPPQFVLYLIGGGFMLLAILSAAGILIYQHRYVMNITFDDVKEEFIIRTDSLIGKRISHYTSDDIVKSVYEDGKYQNIKFTIDAPYIKQKLKDRYFSFIIDMQGDIQDEELFWGREE